MNHEIQNALLKLKKFIEAENYMGYDPYDALLSPLFRLPFLRSNYTVRFLSQQLVKRTPLNLRPLLGIKKSLNPVTLGLCIQGYSDMCRAGLITIEETSQVCDKLISKLRETAAQGYHGICWGYNFPWQSKHFRLKSYEPSIVATGIITNGLFSYYLLSKKEEVFKLCESAADFVLKDINRIESKKGEVCLSYTPVDSYCVYNAAMKGARLLIQVYSVNRDEKLRTLATEVVKYVTTRQNDDGSWYYAEGSKGKWIDNYHTGYVLDCLKTFNDLSGNESFNVNHAKGLKFYLDHFIAPDGAPAFYHNRPYPVDCTSGAQTILTLCENEMTDAAVNTGNYLIRSMQASNGGFYFRKTASGTTKISFMRWSDAWMFAALSKLALQLN